MSTTSESTKTSQFLSLTAVARRLGMAKSELCRLRHQHPLYAPAVSGVPGSTKKVGGRSVGTRLTRFHVRQVELIEGVLVGAVELETAWLKWQVFRGKMGMEARE